jgi:TPR repeat protein
LGDAEAQYRFGEMHRRGQGVPKSFVKALEWYRRAADQGQPRGQHYLGFGYLYGQNLPQDPVLAYMWFSLAAAGGIESDNNVLDQLATKMTPEQIAEAQRLAREWKPQPEQP